MHSPEQRQPRFSPARRGLAAVALVSAFAVGATATWSVNSANPEVAVISGAPDAPERVVGAGVDSYAPVVSKIAPAVVTVHSERRARMTSQQRGQGDDPFREFFGERFGIPGVPNMPAPDRRRGGLGSGVIVNGDGYILTNHHVIAGADTVKVELTDRRHFDAKVIGSDQPSDLAVLKIEAKGLPVVPLGNSEYVRVGDVVLAIGNPLGVGQTVTMGIISAKGRATGLGDGSFEDFLQTDAPINSGNSGGALINTKGELVGINSQILSPSGGNIGIGFSIPVNMAQTVMRDLMDDGRVQRGRLGVTVQPMTPELARSLQLNQIAGALISDVTPNSAAARAGIKRGDVVMAINGEAVIDSNALRNKIAQLGPGGKAQLKIVRQGQTLTLNATLDELPTNTRAAAAPAEREADRTAAGLTVEPLTPARARELGLDAESGLLVTRVTPDGAAADAGFQAGDVIEEVDGQAVKSAAALRQSLAASDRPALVLVRRGDATIFIPLERKG